VVGRDQGKKEAERRASSLRKGGGRRGVARQGGWFVRIPNCWSGLEMEALKKSGNL